MTNRTFTEDSPMIMSDSSTYSSIVKDRLSVIMYLELNLVPMRIPMKKIITQLRSKQNMKEMILVRFNPLFSILFSKIKFYRKNV